MRKIFQQLDATIIIQRGEQRRTYLRPGSADFRQPDSILRIYRPTLASEARIHRLLMSKRTNWRYLSHYGNLFAVHIECSIAWATFQ